MKERGSSRLEAFHRAPLEERRARVLARTGPDGGGFDFDARIPIELVERMVENALGTFDMPLGVATNFRVNGTDLLLPMAIEEPSVIAAASNAAKMVRSGGGFWAEVDPPRTAVQVELRDPAPGAASRIRAAEAEIRSAADATQPELVALGGGTRELIVREAVGGASRLVVHLVVDCLDAMGANMVNTMAEAVSDRLAALAGAQAGLRILTNLADRRLARARAEVPFEALSRPGFTGEAVALGVRAASDFAEADPYRAATHNKGIFNGIDALLLATGNDWRAVEAGGHAYAARSGTYGPLATWHISEKRLVGAIELPMAVGIVGGAARSHPTARFCTALAGVESAVDLAAAAVSVGLASNLAALAALSSEGIQKGHMRLHERRLKK